MTEPVGIIYPPPELRGIVDSTAKYVAKNGGKFEERIKAEHKDKPKFGFLFSNDPFNAYYQFKVKEIRDQLLGGLDRKLEAPEQSQTQQPTSQNSDNLRQNEPTSLSEKNSHDPHHDDGYQSPSENQPHHQEEADAEVTDNEGETVPRVRMKLDEYIQEKTIRLEEPPRLNYLAAPAPSLSYLDCDIIKLTAQFVATYGRSFLLELVAREQSNGQFDFLKPQHGQFSYFTNLVMQYALIRNQPLDILDQLSTDATSQRQILEKIRSRAEWNRMLEAEKIKRQEAEEREKQLYAEIDWHDFVIKETIEFYPNERGEFAPTTADQVGTRLLQQQRLEEQNVPEEMDIDMDMDSDQEVDQGDEYVDEQQNDTNNFVVPSDIMPPRLDKVIIRKDYDPKAAAVRATQPDNYFVSPITNERIPVDKVHEHVRYNLSDPRYLEKKNQMIQEKINEEEVFASGSQIQDSLKNLAERRTDIFGTYDTETAIGQRIGEEEEPQSKDDRIIWDGHKSSLKKKKLG